MHSVDIVNKLSAMEHPRLWTVAKLCIENAFIKILFFFYIHERCDYSQNL